MRLVLPRAMQRRQRGLVSGGDEGAGRAWAGDGRGHGDSQSEDAAACHQS